MDSIDNILAAGSSVNWTTQAVDIEEIEKKYGFPQIVKVSGETSEKYGLPENEPVMLFGRRLLTRTVAQTIEEGHYVMGKQLEISNEFVGSFRISHDYERDEIPLKMFKTIQEVADYFPSKIYVLDQVPLQVRSAEGSNPVFLEHGDELTLVSRSDVQPVVGNPNKPASRFISKVMSKTPQQVALIVHNTRLNESIPLPLTLRGTFITRSPIEFAQAQRSRDMAMDELSISVNYPITVIVTSNRTRSPKDEFVLRSGMHLKLMSIEEHDIVLAVTPFQRITEFSATAATFFLPSAIVNPQENPSDRKKYQTYVQTSYMTTQLQSSVTSIDNYCKSVRFHVPRHLRPTNPTPLPSNANQRKAHFKVKPKPPALRPYSAIQLLSQGPENSPSQGKGPSKSGSMSRRSLPIPQVNQGTVSGPPLPPRNAASPVPVRRHNQAPPPPPFAPASLSTGPPVPPKSRGRMPQDMPARPAPTPFSVTSTSSSPSFVSVNSTSSATSSASVNSKVASGVVPLPVSKDFPSRSHEEKTVNGVNCAEQEEDDSIWEEWNPPEVRKVSVDSLEISPTGLNPEKLQNGDAPSIDEPRARGEVPTSKRTASLPGDPDRAPGSDAREQGEKPQWTPPAVMEADDGRVKLSLPDLHDGDFSSMEAVANSLLNGSNDDLASRSAFSEELETVSCRSKMSQKSYLASPTGWNPPDVISAMSVEDVTHSLRHIGLSEDVVQYFYNERIDGQMLTELTDEILEMDFELGGLYRHKITRFLQGWRPKMATAEAT